MSVLLVLVHLVTHERVIRGYFSRIEGISTNLSCVLLLLEALQARRDLFHAGRNILLREDPLLRVSVLLSVCLRRATGVLKDLKSPADVGHVRLFVLALHVGTDELFRRRHSNLSDQSLQFVPLHMVLIVLTLSHDAVADLVADHVRATLAQTYVVVLGTGCSTPPACSQASCICLSHVLVVHREVHFDHLPG